MDAKLLTIYQHQVQVQCWFVWKSYEQLFQVHEHKPKTTLRLFWQIQSLVVSAASVRRAMWGQDPKTCLARLPLRQSLETDDSSPINSPDMRNNFEHFDDRIEKWWKRSNRANFIDLNVMPIDMLAVTDEVNLFRTFDPVSGELYFWGDRLNVHEISHEAKRIHAIACRELSKHQRPMPIEPLE